jgi:hypothetical protein
MILAITVYLIIGAGVNMHLHLKNAKQISSIVTSGYIGVISVLLAGMLNHFIWPLSLYLDNKNSKP